MAYITTALGMKLADPLTIQAFETTQVNANFMALENGILADRAQLGTGTVAEQIDAVLNDQTFIRYTTKALMDANTTAAVGAHATVYADPTPANNGDYTRSSTAWVRTTVDDTGWTAFPFGPGWADYIPASWGATGYRKVGSRVTLRGIPTSGAGNTLIGTLPVGFRPAFDAQFVVQLGTGPASISVAASGAISLAAWPGGTVTVSWGHLSFLVG